MEAWYKRIFLWGQTNLTEDDPEKCDLDFWIDYWKKTGVEGIIINCGGIVSYYQSKYDTQYRAAFLGDKDYFGIWNDAAREAGLTVVARMDINATSGKMYEEHPEWYCRDRNGDVIMSQGRYVTCVNGGYYQEFLPRVFEEIIDKYHPDGFADNSWAGLKRDTICYCDSCRKKFREEYGLDLPGKTDWTDSVYRKWVRWNYALRVKNWKYFNDVTRRAGGEECRWFGMLTADPFDTGGRFYDIRELVKDADFIFSDQQSRENMYGFEQNAVNGNLLRLVSSENIIVAESMAHYYKGIRTFRLSAAPAQEVRNWMMCGVAGGIAPWYHFVGGGTQDKRKFHISDDLFQILKKEKRYLTNRVNYSVVGIVWNQESAIYYGRDQGKERCGYPFYGFAKALSAAGIPFMPVHADDLAKYADRLKAVVLPNVAILTESQEKAVIDFVQQGKGLVITGWTGMMDEEGEERPEGSSELMKCLGIRKSGGVTGAGRDSSADWMHHESHNYLAVSERHPLLAGLEETSFVTFGGEVLQTVSEGPLKQVMHLIPAFPIYPPEFAWIREERADLSAAYAGVLDSGARVVCLPADIDRCYIRFCLPDLGVILQNAVRYVAGGNFPVTVSGPGHIHCETYRQENRLLIHLVNLSGCDGVYGSVIQNFPIGPVEIRIKDVSIKQEAVSLITGKSHPISQEECTCIRLERLEEQELIAVEMNC